MVSTVLFQYFTSLKEIPRHDYHERAAEIEPKRFPEVTERYFKNERLSVLRKDYSLMLVPINLQQVCGHKWADLSEHDWGVALMTDCKYGYSTHANVMYISL